MTDEDRIACVIAAIAALTEAARQIATHMHIANLAAADLRLALAAMQREDTAAGEIADAAIARANWR